MKSLAAFLVLLVLCGPVFIASRVRAQEDKKPPQEKEQETVKLETTLVPVTFVVKDKKGNFIDQLKKEDFQIYEDGKEVDIAQFGVSPFALDVQEPLAVAILNVAGDGILASTDTTEIVSTVVNSVDKRTSVGFFWGLTTLHTSQWFTTDKSLQRAASALRWEDQSKVVGYRYLYRVSREAVSLLNSVADMPGAPPRKKILFILSEGYTFDSPKSRAPSLNWFPSNYAQAWKAVQEGNVILYGVVSDPSWILSGYLYGPPFMAYQEFVEGVGGRLLTYKSKSKRFADVFSELRHSYAVGYYLPAHEFDGKFHKIKVVCRRPEARVVDARKGYWAARPEDMPAGEEGRPREKLGKVESEAEEVFSYLPSTSEGGEPMRGSLTIEQGAKVPSGETSVNLNVTFDTSSLRPTVETAQRWGGYYYYMRDFETYAYFNYDLWFEVYRDGESSPLRQWERNFNISIKDKELPQHKETGMKWREPIDLPPGRYKARVVAMEPSTLRSVELTTALAIGAAGGGENPSVGAPDWALRPRDCSVAASLSPAAPLKPAGSEDLNAAGKKSLGMTLLIDANERTAKDSVNELATSVDRFLPALSAEDVLEVKSAGSRVEQVLPPTRNHILSMEAIKGIRPAVSDATRVNGYQAILCSASAVRPEGQPVFVWLTNLNESFNDYFQLIYVSQQWNGRAEHFYRDYSLTLAPYDEALKAAREKGIAVYAVVLPNKLPKFRVWEEFRKNREKRLQKFAEATGGRLIKVSKIEEVGDALREIVQEQRGFPRSPGSRQRR